MRFKIDQGIFFVGLLFVCALPAVASAQVVISEIMYDATGGDTDQEYVEVFNAGTSPIDLTTWKINDGSNHTLNVPPKNGGTGSIILQPGAYALVVDNAANFLALHSGVTSSVVDSVLSLPNAGGGISIIDGTGTAVDSLTYTKDQGAAGDGNSLTRVSIAGSFTPATPTPGTGALSSGNSDGGFTNDADQSSATTAGQSSSGNSSADAIMPPPPKVVADAGSDRTVIVGADTEFKARAYDEKKNVITFSHFLWNFGDGSTSNAAVVSHHFDYPGRYVVVLELPDEPDASADQVVVTVEPMKLALSLMQDGGVAIENRAGRTLDLSRWMVRSMSRTFTIPERTFILAGSSLRISPKTLGFASGADVELAYPGGASALRIAPPESTSTPSVALEAAAPRAQHPSESGGAKNTAPAPQREDPAVEEVDIATSPEQRAPEQTASAASTWSGSSPKWWLGVLGVAGLAAGSIVFARRFGKKEWDIIEENDGAV